MELRPLTICNDCLLLSTRRIRVSNVRSTGLVSQYSQLLQAPTLSTSQWSHDSIRYRRPQLHQARRYATPISLSSKPDLSALLMRVEELTQTVLKPKDGPIPSEQRVLYVLEQIDAIARSIADANSIAGAVSLDGSATSALLGSVSKKRGNSSITKAVLLSTISKRAESIMQNPKIFITPAVLQAYVQLQRLLQQPASLPAIFQLYATKPAPHSSGKDVMFKETSPNSVKAAIDRETANAALATAIKAHNLDLALDIIDTSLAAPAYGRAKVLRQCALPGVAFALMPAVAYGLSAHFGTWQSMMSSSQATGVAFAGIMTYVGVVGSMGYVALTTANDQMDRVTWAHGVPLWERWIREEERAAFDKIANAWGFKSVEKRGDEEGQDWETLREICGRRGFELDRVELMEGMQ